MLRQMLKQHFGIQAEEELRIGLHEAFKKDNQLYIPMEVGLEEEDLAELSLIASHLQQTGDKTVSTFLQTTEGKHSSVWEQKSYCVLKCPNAQPRKGYQSGRKLAKFHYRGRLISSPITRTSRIGQWKQLWEKRLDQMEKVWNNMLFQQPEHELDRMFLETFPYYMGLAENSIQYLADAELDDEPGPSDSGTVCHERFVSSTWGSDDYLIKSPFDWVFDHASRDLAEWSRERYFRNIKTYQPGLSKYLKEYQTVEPLTSFSWRLLYARLLFPLHYFECIENYYGNPTEHQRHLSEEQLGRFLQHTGDHEEFLGKFFEMAEVPAAKMKLPPVDWLKR